MHLTAIFAQLCCRDLEVGIAWFSALFARPPDARPMDGLAEWHHGAEAGLQLRLAPDHAGHGTLTLIVPDLAASVREEIAGLAPFQAEVGGVCVFPSAKRPRVMVLDMEPAAALARIDAQDAGMLRGEMPGIPQVIDQHETDKRPARNLGKHNRRQRHHRDHHEPLRSPGPSIRIGRHQQQRDPAVWRGDEMNLPVFDVLRVDGPQEAGRGDQQPGDVGEEQQIEQRRDEPVGAGMPWKTGHGTAKKVRRVSEQHPW